MQIRLKNIGIIKDSTIVLDGLTVITGKNNSGKTTVGKTLYSLFDAVANIQRKAENDKCVYVIRHLNNLDNTLEFLRYSRPAMRSDDPDFFSAYPTLKAVVTGEFRREISPATMEELVYKLIDELKKLDTSYFVEQVETSRNSRIFRIKALSTKKFFSANRAVDTFSCRSVYFCSTTAQKEASSNSEKLHPFNIAWLMIYA